MRRPFVLALVVAAGVLSANSAVAQSPSGDSGAVRRPSDTLLNAPIPPGQSPYLPDGRTRSGGGSEPIPCRCVYQGQKYTVGTTVCVRLPGVSRQMRCELIENNTSWVPEEDGRDCEVARLM